jgi:hypothetical protein
VVPVLIAAFTVTRPDPLPPPRLEPSFDGTTASQFARELARRYPDRAPGSAGAAAATRWVEEQLTAVGLRPVRDEFEASVAGLGREPFVNLVAVAPGRSPDTIVVVAHRDNAGLAPGASDNASGTAALLEIARNVDVSQPARTLLFLSSDGGAFGGVGAARFASRPEILRRHVGPGAAIVAVVNLDALASSEPPRLAFGGDSARSPAGTLVATADRAVAVETERPVGVPSALAQIVDLAFPFTLHEHGPFVARGTPAVTLTTGGERPAEPEADTLAVLDDEQLARLGRAAQSLVLSLDERAELARTTESYVYAGERTVRGWAIQLLLLAALVPFLVTTVDLFARCRRRRVALGPALRSYVTRFGVWAWIAVLVALWSYVGLLPSGEPRPVSPDSSAAGDWAVAALVALGLVAAIGWLGMRPRLALAEPATRREELGGHLAAMLVLGTVALVVGATNPYALVFLLPSLHAWLWLPHVPRRNLPLRVAIFALGLAGPALLVGSFAVRFGLGWDAPWYLLALVSVGYVAPPFLVAGLVWAAVAAQVGALAVNRYAPYPGRLERRSDRRLRRALGTAQARRAPARPELHVVGEEEPP